MKSVKLFVLAAMISAFATASFAGSCCSKKKECSDDKAKAEQKDPAKKEEPKKDAQPK